MKKLFILIFSSLLIIGTGPAWALTYYYTDNTTKAGFDIEYILNISDGAGSNEYDGLLTINSSSTSADLWYAGAFNFKFFDGSVPTELDLNSYTGSTGGWTAADKDNNVSIDGWSSLTQAGRAGFYVTNLASDLSLPNVARGVEVSGTNTATFDFSFSGLGDLNEMYVPFQVAYWDGFAGRSQNVKFGQLSAELAVPEPASMLLLGTGLIGLAGLRRRFKK